MELGLHPNSAFVCFMAFFKLNIYTQTVKNSFSAVPEKNSFSVFQRTTTVLVLWRLFYWKHVMRPTRKHQESKRFAQVLTNQLSLLLYPLTEIPIIISCMQGLLLPWSCCSGCFSLWAIAHISSPTSEAWKSLHFIYWQSIFFQSQFKVAHFLWGLC